MTKEEIEALKAYPSEQKAAEKSARLAAVGKHLFTRRGLQVNIEYIGTADSRLKVVVSAKQNGKDIDLQEVNPIYFVNPPIMHNGASDEQEVLEEIITQALEVSLKK